MCLQRSKPAGYGIITFTYDALGRRTVKEDQQGDTACCNFDMSGRVLTRVYVGHPTSPLAGQTDTDTFTYDPNGRMLSGIKGRYNNTVTFSYDDRGQQMQETLTTHGRPARAVLEATLSGMTSPSPAAFPVDAPEWNDIDPQARVFGIRRFLRQANASDLSDLRRFDADASAFSFSIDASASNAVISIRGANADAQRRLKGILFEYVEKTSRNVTSTPDVFQIQLYWKDPERSPPTPDGLPSILLTWLGFAVMI